MFPDRGWTKRDVVEHFRYSLGRMVEMTRQADVPLLLVNPVSNLRDYRPFKSQHREGLTADELRRWESLDREAVYWMSAAMLVTMAGVSALTGARTSVLPMKLCPFIKTGVAAAFVLGSFS